MLGVVMVAANAFANDTPVCKPYDVVTLMLSTMVIMVLIVRLGWYRRDKTVGGSWLFTAVTYGRQPVLCDEPVRAALRKAIMQTRLKWPFRIDAWVLLVDHLHCIWTLPEGDADFLHPLEFYQTADFENGSHDGAVQTLRCGADDRFKTQAPRADLMATAVLGTPNPRRKGF
jgi:hypothetical protein